MWILKNKKPVEIQIREYYRKKAITILKNSVIIDNWINHYSPGGIRYKIHKTSYQELAGDYKGHHAK